MRYSITIIIPMIFLVVFSLFLPIVFADNGSNDDIDNAETIEVDNFSGSVIKGMDDEDWYVIEVPPFTNLKITVELLGPSSNDILNISIVKEGGQKVESFDITLDRSLTKDDDTYRNDGSDYEEIYLGVEGEGSYEVDLYYERDLAGGLCGSNIMITMAIFVIIIFALIKIR